MVDTAGHLVKGKVLLEKVVDANTPLIQGDHSRMVQVSFPTALFMHRFDMCWSTASGC